METNAKQNNPLNKKTESRRTRITRIKRMEEILDKSSAAVLNMKQALADYIALAGNMHELEQYYTSRQWQKDFAEDEAGRLPKNLKRGVLSEDAVYNFLALRDEVETTIRSLYHESNPHHEKRQPKDFYPDVE